MYRFSLTSLAGRNNVGGFPKCLRFGKIDAVFGLVRLAFGGIEFERHGIVLMRLRGGNDPS
jgi:hypothetical protein